MAKDKKSKDKKIPETKEKDIPKDNGIIGHVVTSQYVVMIPTPK